MGLYAPRYSSERNAALGQRSVELEGQAERLKSAREEAQAEQMQARGRKFASVEAQPEYEKYVREGERTDRAVAPLRERQQAVEGVAERIAPYVPGGENGAAANLTRLGLEHGAGVGDVAAMTEEELGRYYYLASQDPESGREYLEYLKGPVAERRGREISENVLELENPVARNVAIPLVSAAGGLESAGKGLYQSFRRLLGDERPVAQGELAKAHEATRPELKGMQGVVSDAAYTVGNVLPAVAAGAATGNPVVGAAVQGLSGAGESYARKRREGAADAQAAAYSALTGAADMALSYLMGGLDKVGGGIMRNAAGKSALGKQAVKITGALERVAKDAGGAGGDQGSGEGLLADGERGPEPVPAGEFGACDQRGVPGRGVRVSAVQRGEAVRGADGGAERRGVRCAGSGAGVHGGAGGRAGGDDAQAAGAGGEVSGVCGERPGERGAVSGRGWR